MRIGELATATGTTVRALRYYEEQGLLGSARTAGGHRTYAEDAPARVAWIRRLLDAGLSSPTLRDLLPCIHTGVTPDTVARLRHERDRLDEVIAGLVATRERLDDLVEGSGDP